MCWLLGIRSTHNRAIVFQVHALSIVLLYDALERSLCQRMFESFIDIHSHAIHHGNRARKLLFCDCIGALYIPRVAVSRNQNASGISAIFSVLVTRGEQFTTGGLLLAF